MSAEADEPTFPSSFARRTFVVDRVADGAGWSEPTACAKAPDDFARHSRKMRRPSRRVARASSAQTRDVPTASLRCIQEAHLILCGRSGAPAASLEFASELANESEIR